MLNCAPKPHVIQSWKNQNISWAQALAEWIDNSFDAGANKVEIRFNGNSMEIFDDGVGVSDVSALIALGSHHKRSTTSLGMYGVGAKDAWLSCANVMRVETVNSGRLKIGTFDIEEIASNNWLAEEPTEVDSDQPSYTKLTFELHPSKKKPDQRAFATIGWLFRPALQNGMQIVVRHGKKKARRIEPCPMPELQESIRDSFEVDGKAVSIDIGIVPDGQAMERGPFWVQYEHRVIMKTSIGVGSYSCDRVGGLITIGPGWRLTKNKDQISESDLDRLGEAIHERIKPLLAKAEQLSESEACSAMRHELEEQLNAALCDESGGDKDCAKERRKNGETKGTVAATGRGSKRENAERFDVLELGSVKRGGKKRNKPRGFHFDFYTDSNQDVIGSFDHTAFRVRLNKSHSLVDKLRKEKNKPGLLVIATALIADYAATHDGEQRLLTISYGNFTELFGRVTQSIRMESSHAEDR